MFNMHIINDNFFKDTVGLVLLRLVLLFLWLSINHEIK